MRIIISRLLTQCIIPIVVEVIEDISVRHRTRNPTMKYNSTAIEVQLLFDRRSAVQRFFTGTRCRCVCSDVLLLAAFGPSENWIRVSSVIEATPEVETQISMLFFGVFIYLPSVNVGD